jgi:tetratricopeptide (TPR) repeat protein
MIRKLLLAISAFAMASALMADFPDDFQAARKFFDTGKNKEAQEFFEKLAASAPTPKNKAECLSYAAKALGRDKTQYDAAIEAAKKIEVKEISISTQMSLMIDSRKFKELLDAFKDEDFGKFPEVYQQQTYYMRGYAERQLGQSDAAKKDFIKAVETAGSDSSVKINALAALDDVYFQAKDYENVVKTSKQVFELKGFNNSWCYLVPVLNCANAQVAQGKLDDALETMKLLDHMNSGVYRCQALVLLGDIYAAQGKKDEAAKNYNEAAGMKGQSGIQDYLPAQAQKKKEELGKQVE